MEKKHEILLAALACALKGKNLAPVPEVTAPQWQEILSLAAEHRILPLILEAVYRQPGLKGSSLTAGYRGRVMQTVFAQTTKTVDFLELYGKLRRAGVTPLVVKGIICRQLYPVPDYRPSGDEDVLIPPEQFPAAHQVFLDYGMQTTEPEDGMAESYEIPYRKSGSLLYIELHKHLFPPQSRAYGHLNGFFEGIHNRAVEENIQGTGILTMAPTDHLFYLICHAFKHFLHSGFGIRQVCDIVLYAERYHQQIDWDLVLENCRQIRADRFAAAMLRIGENHLQVQMPWLPECWKEIEVDEEPMLLDLLDSGIYGSADMSRKHSSTITLTAVENQKTGKRSGGVLRSLFPAAKDLERRYPYLKKYPVLLPVAWASRIASYGAETAKSERNNAAESIRIGAERVELMKQYCILDE